jgi:diguanylate cyclase (GGDEF)-like protein
MPSKSLHAPIQLRAYWATTVATGVLVSIIAAIGLVAFCAPALARPFTLPLGAALIFGALLAGVLLYSGHLSLRDEIERAATTFQHGLASAHRDTLTGAMTRSYFLIELKNRLRRLDEESVAYAQIDMDHLKQLNDGAGHAAGDAALKHLMTTVQSALPDAIIGRLGGDEFGVIVLGHDNIRAISRLFRQMLDALSVPTVIVGRHVSLSASVGFALAPRHSSQTDDLMSKADLALYKGKRTGRNNVVAFEEDMLLDERHKRFIQRELRAAIFMNELDLYYQPIYENDGKTLKSYEALVRWNHTVRGIIPPSDFIPIAEAGELIEKLGDWVLNRACCDFDILAAPSLSINVSPVQLRRSGYADRFAAILTKTGVSPANIAVEITETVPLTAQGVEMVNLESLKRLGVSIVIDDFGSGNASLSYLKHSFFDVLKIDRSYVENIVSNRFDSLMIASVCRIAQAIDMTVIAEGIENKDQMHAVTAAGVTELQGFYLGRPKPLRAILAERRARGTEYAA